jgi:DNA-directed RNA polymerase specialized sigma24 family protein
MTVTRLERTFLHRSFGIFRYSEELEKGGISTPSAQIVALGRFVQTVLGQRTDLPSPGEGHRAEEWMRNALAEALPDLRRSALLEPLEYVTLRVHPVVAWNVYSDFAELLNLRSGPAAYASAAARLRGHNFVFGLAELSDLTSEFVLGRLPRAVRAFDPRRGAGHEVAWLANVFYRFALQTILADRVDRSHVEVLSDLIRAQAASETPESLMEEDQKELALLALPAAMDRLKPQVRSALELYFGFRGSPSTMEEVGRALGVSAYQARSAVVHGMAELAATLGVRGLLEPRELHLAQLTYAQGLNLEAAARRLQMTPHQALTLQKQFTGKLRSALRLRTHPAALRSKVKEQDKEKPMKTGITLKPDEIIARLSKLKAAPELRPGPGGQVMAHLDADWVPVQSLLPVVSDPHVLKILQEENVPLAWMAAGAAAEERPDLPADISQWRASMEAARQRTWQVAETLFYQCKDRADAEKLPFLQEDEYEVAVERIHLSLAGISQSLASEIPAQCRRKETAVLRIDRPGIEKREMVWAAWEGDPAEARFDLTDLAEHCAELHGGLPSGPARLFACALVRELFENEITLPAFTRGQSTDDTLWLQWKAPAQAAKSAVGVKEASGYA